MAPIVSFVIPVRNDADRLRHCLQTIRANAYPPELVEVLVVDNGSTDASPTVAQESGSTLICLPNERVSSLRNAGVTRARGEVIAFVDADHGLDRGWISAAVETLADKSVGATGAEYLPPQNATWVQKAYDLLRRHAPGRQRTEWLGGGNLAVRREAFLRVGGFDTQLETCEDVDLCRKLRLNGFELVADSRLASEHYGDPQTLRQVFYGELWRGRDNIRVSLRPPRTVRTLASAFIPVLNLGALVVLATAWLLPNPFRRPALLAAAAVLFSTVLLRVFRMTRGRLATVIPGAMAVGTAYEFARALALLARVGHGARRGGR